MLLEILGFLWVLYLPRLYILQIFNRNHEYAVINGLKKIAIVHEDQKAIFTEKQSSDWQVSIKHYKETIEI